MKKKRIFIGTTEIGGNYTCLHQSLLRLGYKADFFLFAHNGFHYNAHIHPLAKIVQHLRKKNTPFARRLEMAMRYMVLGYALLNYDVFLFAAHKSILPDNSDLRILKKFKKRIISQSHGSDVRPAYLNGKRVAGYQADLPRLLQKTRQIKNTVRLFERYADYIIDIPPQTMLRKHKRCINRLYLGMCKDMPPNFAEQLHSLPLSESRPVKILHCPSNPTVKGSDEIQKILESLDPAKVEWQFLSGVSNQEILKAMRESDIIIDQLYSDHPCPNVSAEAAWLGKPVLLGGYAADLWREWIDPNLLPPIRYCQPEDFAEQLNELINHPEERVREGQKLRTFMQEHWSIDKVTERYLRIINDDVPEEWFFDPADITYLPGCGLPRTKALEMIQAITSQYGPDALLLDDSEPLPNRHHARSGLKRVFNLLRRKKRVCILVFNPYVIDWRVARTAETLAANSYIVHVVARKSKTGAELPDFEVRNGVRIHRFLLREPFCCDFQGAKSLVKLLCKIRLKFSHFDIIHANDVHTLELGHQLAKLYNARLVYDSHELFYEKIDYDLATLEKEADTYNLTRLMTKKLSLSRLQKLEFDLVPRCDAMITVSDTIMGIIDQRFKKLNKKIKHQLVLRSIPPLNGQIGTNGNGKAFRYFHRHFNLPPTTKVLLYQGNIHPDRGIFEMAQAMPRIQDQPPCVFVNMGRRSTKDNYIDRAIEAGGGNGKVLYKEPVCGPEFPKWTASADIGIIPILAVNDKLKYCLPNKLFEYIQAGLPVIYSHDLVEVGNIVEKYGIGLAVDVKNPANIAEAIQTLLDNKEIRERIDRNLIKARRELNWENEQVKLLKLYDQLLRKKKKKHRTKAKTGSR